VHCVQIRTQGTPWQDNKGWALKKGWAMPICANADETV
jgi:hypothetical protein